MAELTIRDIPQQELDALAARASRHGRSTEAEARQVLHEAATEELLLQQLETAKRAAEAVRAAEAQQSSTATGTATRRRYRRFEPTRGRS